MRRTRLPDFNVAANPSLNAAYRRLYAALVACPRKSSFDPACPDVLRYVRDHQKAPHHL